MMSKKNQSTLEAEADVFESMLSGDPMSEIRLPTKVLKEVIDTLKRRSYETGYNSGYIKARRYDPEQKLLVVANELTDMAEHLKTVSEALAQNKD